MNEDIKKEIERVRKELDKIEEEPNVLQEAEEFQKKISCISIESLLKKFNI